MEDFEFHDGAESTIEKSSFKKVIFTALVFVIIMTSFFMILDFDKDGLSNFSEFLHHETDFLELDTDRDGLDDKFEIENQLNPKSKDSDFDGLTDGQEVKYVFSNPLNSDTDNDSLSDGYEINTLKTNPLLGDTDFDNLSDYYETKISFTNPSDSDSDGDNLNDGDELNKFQTNPLKLDTDDDGLNDDMELFVYETHPNIIDSDGDSLGDGYEIFTTLTNPNSVDSDGDGFDDAIDLNPNIDIKIIIEFGFEAYSGDGWSGPDPYFEFYFEQSNQLTSYWVTDIYTDTYVKSLGLQGSFIYDWNDTIDYVEVTISGYDSDAWNADERLDLGGADTSDIIIELLYNSIIESWKMDYTSSYGDNEDAAYYEGYPCEFSIRISLV